MQKHPIKPHLVLCFFPLPSPHSQTHELSNSGGSGQDKPRAHPSLAPSHLDTSLPQEPSIPGVGDARGVWLDMAPPQERDYIGLSPAMAATELRLGLPGTEEAEGREAVAGTPLTLELFPKGGAKRGFADAIVRRDAAATGKAPADDEEEDKKKAQAPAAKAQVVGWPPIRSYRKNTMAMNQGCLYVKVSMDGAPYLRKVDLKMYNNYRELSLALEKMFSSFTVGDNESNGKSGREGLSDCRLMDHKNGTELVLTYKDKDGDWMLVGDVPWRMFTGSCRRLRIMKGSDAVGLAPRATEKSKIGN